MKISDSMNPLTIRKKILLASKLIGVVLIVSYILSDRLPVSTDISFAIWIAFVVVLICGIDLLMARFITKPVSELNKAAQSMAELDFSGQCSTGREDELGCLAQNLNSLSASLSTALNEQYV